MDKICEIQTLAYSRENAVEILNALFEQNLISDARIQEVEIAVKKTFDAGGVSFLKRCELTMRTRQELARKAIALSNRVNQVLDPEVTVATLEIGSDGYIRFVNARVSADTDSGSSD